MNTKGKTASFVNKTNILTDLSLQLILSTRTKTCKASLTKYDTTFGTHHKCLEKRTWLKGSSYQFSLSILKWVNSMMKLKSQQPQVYTTLNRGPITASYFFVLFMQTRVDGPMLMSRCFDHSRVFLEGFLILFTDTHTKSQVIPYHSRIQLFVF